jgi:hypothetical protein
VGFEKRLNPETFLNVPGNSIVVSSCRGWHGMNDRFAMVSLDAANTYFRRPYKVSKKGEAIDYEMVAKPETFLLNVNTAANVNISGSKHIDDVYRIFLSNGEPKYYEDEL